MALKEQEDDRCRLKTRRICGIRISAIIRTRESNYNPIFFLCDYCLLAKKYLNLKACSVASLQ